MKYQKKIRQIKNTVKAIKNLLYRLKLVEFLGLIIELLAIAAIVFSILWIFRPIARWVFLGILILLLFRIAHRIPLLGKRWVWFFGERQFWDWMSLLCAPLILSLLGLSISTNINKSQGDISVISDRLNISNEYYKQISDLILSDGFQKLIKSKNKELIVVPFENNENCDPDRNNPLTSIGYTRTISTLRSLSKLRTSDEKYTPLKRGIVQTLYYSGLIKRYSSVISLQKAALNETDLSNIDLSGSCFDSVDFSGSNLASIKINNSNLMRTNLRNSNLQRAKLQWVNLIKSDLSNANLSEANLSNANLSKTILKEADLRGSILHMANLQGSDLSESDLRGADLSGAFIDEETNFENAVYNTEPIKINKVKYHFLQHIIEYLSYIVRIEDFIPKPIELKSTNFQGITLVKITENGQLKRNSETQVQIQQNIISKMQKKNKP